MEQRDYIAKEGALYVIEELVAVIMSTRYKSDMEQLLMNHVYEELSSPVIFLKARAAAFIYKYTLVDWADLNNLRKLAQGVWEALVTTDDLVVRVHAASTIREIIQEQLSCVRYVPLRSWPSC